MRPLSDTLGRLAALRDRPRRAANAATTRLVRLEDFGSNPGKLEAWFHLPENLRADTPLVVVLHGCTQNAAGYDRGAGWSQLADRHGFAVLLPEQRRSNNMNLCFNWYEPAHARRDAGEPLSIRQMIQAMVARHRIDPARVFITGLSAGGAMASVMLATYPEVFAGGAIIAGLPYGTASNIPEAFDRMRGHGGPDGAGLAAAVRAASPHKGPWPKISVWHGSADHTVDASNGTAIVEQWRRVHGADARPSRSDTVDGYPRRVWHGADGRVAVEEYVITGMGHGTPLDTAGEKPYEEFVGANETVSDSRFKTLQEVGYAPPSDPDAFGDLVAELRSLLADDGARRSALTDERVKSMIARVEPSFAETHRASTKSLDQRM